LAEYNYDLSKITFSGYVRDSGGVGISGVVMGGLPNNPVTDANGYYSDAVSYGWTGTVTPSKSGYTFTPASRSYSNVTSNQTGQNYTGAPVIVPTFTISGNAGVAGAILSYTDGTAKTATTDGSGNYSFSVSNNWTGTVTPSKSGYTFTPVSRSYSNVTSDQAVQNYTGAPVIVPTFTISGNAGVAGAILSYTDGTAKSATADGSGNYSFSVSNNWTGTVTPSKSGYTFTPASRSYSNVTSSQTGQNYTATLITFMISGNAGVAGAILSYTDGTAKSATADGSGNYSFSASNNWTGTVTPSKSGCSFTPVSRSYSNVTSNQTGQDYTGTISEVISTPKTPSGATSGYMGTSYKFSTSGSSSSLGSSHPVQYQFDWGDGTFSSWGSPSFNTYSQSHVWTLPGTYSVKAQARCKNHPSSVSAWSNFSSISVQGKPFIKVTSPNGERIW